MVLIGTDRVAKRMKHGFLVDRDRQYLWARVERSIEVKLLLDDGYQHVRDQSAGIRAACAMSAKVPFKAAACVRLGVKSYRKPRSCQSGSLESLTERPFSAPPRNVPSRPPAPSPPCPTAIDLQPDLQVFSRRRRTRFSDSTPGRCLPLSQAVNVVGSILTKTGEVAVGQTHGSASLAQPVREGSGRFPEAVAQECQSALKINPRDFSPNSLNRNRNVPFSRSRDRRRW